MAKQLAFYFDASACTDCKACQIACQDKNDLSPEYAWRRVYQYGGGEWIKKDGVLVPNNVFSYSLSVACMHCEDPLCETVCPSSAITKEDNGVVLIDADKCIGCRYCEWACPYGATIFNEEDGKMTKCNFCVDYLAEGKAPACVDACVMRCLDYGDIDELRAKYGDLSAVEPLPKADITNPAFVMTPHKHVQAAGKGNGRILNLQEEM
jgi:anaerobic dimethyl sulfoxide reductase subunit B (iron-sulfur subunit)